MDRNPEDPEFKPTLIEQTEAAFENIAREWVNINDLWSDRRRKRVLKSLKKDVFNIIGSRPIAEIQQQKFSITLRYFIIELDVIITWEISALRRLKTNGRL